MATLLVIHVIVIGILLSRLPLRSYTFFGFFIYFFLFYIGTGYYISENREAITPNLPLEDDYWDFYSPEKISPFDPLKEPSEEMDEDQEIEENRRLQKRRFEESKDQPTTKP